MFNTNQAPQFQQQGPAQNAGPDMNNMFSAAAAQSVQQQQPTFQTQPAPSGFQQPNSAEPSPNSARGGAGQTQWGQQPQQPQQQYQQPQQPQWQQPPTPQPAAPPAQVGAPQGAAAQWQPVNDPSLFQQQQPSFPQQQQAAPQATQQYPAFDPQLAVQLQQFGVDPNLPPHEQMRALLDRASVMQSYAQVGQQLAPQVQSLLAQANSAQSQQGQQQQQNPNEFDPESYFAEKWNVPAWNEQFDQAIASGIVVEDERTGLYKPGQGWEFVAAPLVGQLNQAVQGQRSSVQRLFRGNPYRQIHEVLKEPLKREIAEEARRIVDQTLAEQRESGELQEFAKANANWLYVVDQSGKRYTTSAGEHFLNEAETLIKNGMPTRQAIETAKRLVGIQVQPNAAQPAIQYQPAQVGQQQNPIQAQPFVMAPAGVPQGQPQAPMFPQQAPGYAMNPQMSGYVQTQYPAQPGQWPAQYQTNPPMFAPPSPVAVSAMQQQSFLDSALQRSSFQPGAPYVPATAPPYQAQPASREELDSMFTVAAQRMGLN